MSEETKQIIELGRGSDSIKRGKEGEEIVLMDINNIHSIESSVPIGIKPSLILGTIGESWNAFSNSSSAGLIPGVGLISEALKAGFSKNEDLSNLFIHGNNASKSMYTESGIKNMSDEERLDIKNSIYDYGAEDLVAQSAAQVAVTITPDFGVDDPYAGSTIDKYVDSTERENIRINERESISTPTLGD
ncbi:MAG: hypothetical protein J6N72_06890 [Psychrobacter sp.]|nr:hypothetical protein [Psychrobacter sp.]